MSTAPTKSALASTGVWGGIVAALTGLINFSHGVNVAGFVQALTDNWGSLVTLFAGAAAVYGRIRANTFISPAPGGAAATVGASAPKLPLILLLILPLGLGLTSCTTTSTSSPLAQDATSLLTNTATAEAAGLAADYLENGSNANFTKDLITGALAQVYTLEGTSTPLAQSTVRDVVSNVITNPTLAAAVTNAAINTLNAVPSGTEKTTAINQGVGVLLTALSQVGT